MERRPDLVSSFKGYLRENIYYAASRSPVRLIRLTWGSSTKYA